MRGAYVRACSRQALTFSSRPLSRCQPESRFSRNGVKGGGVEILGSLRRYRLPMSSSLIVCVGGDKVQRGWVVQRLCVWRLMSFFYRCALKFKASDDTPERHLEFASQLIRLGQICCACNKIRRPTAMRQQEVIPGRKAAPARCHCLWCSVKLKLKHAQPPANAARARPPLHHTETAGMRVAPLPASITCLDDYVSGRQDWREAAHRAVIVPTGEWQHCTNDNTQTSYTQNSPPP